MVLARFSVCPRIESASVAIDDAGKPEALCFDDLAIARGFAAPFEVRYDVQITDGRGAKVAANETATFNFTISAPGKYPVTSKVTNAVLVVIEVD